jgi:hypothetical protein
MLDITEDQMRDMAASLICIFIGSYFTYTTKDKLPPDELVDAFPILKQAHELLTPEELKVGRDSYLGMLESNLVPNIKGLVKAVVEAHKIIEQRTK